VLATSLYLAGIGGAALIVMMLVIWLLSVRKNNAGYVDVGWALGLAILAIWYAWQGPGFSTRKWILAGMVSIWGLRLAIHLLERIAREPEDGRYRQLRQEWQGKDVNVRFFFFFEFQALLDVVLSLPILLAALNPEPVFSILEYLGIGLWLIAVIGEAISDAQLSAFKKNPANRGRVCQAGLWNYSRHPNYFFEWFVWVAWATFALASPWGWLGLISPILMMFFLFRLTGIPATEAQAVRSKGEEYKRYQRTTSALIPWFKKSSAA
jgi:steroid 5-alpha reductase family enzyme